MTSDPKYFVIDRNKFLEESFNRVWDDSEDLALAYDYGENPLPLNVVFEIATINSIGKKTWWQFIAPLRKGQCLGFLESLDSAKEISYKQYKFLQKFYP